MNKTLLFLIIIFTLISSSLFPLHYEVTINDFELKLFSSEIFGTIHLTVKNRKRESVTLLVILSSKNTYQKKVLHARPYQTLYFQFTKIKKSALKLFVKFKYRFEPILPFKLIKEFRFNLN